jgi:hypothetical protein
MKNITAHERRTIKKLLKTSEFWKAERELEYIEGKKKFLFNFRNDQKYYHVNQGIEFEKNLLKHKYDNLTHPKSVKDQGILFNKYSINLGHPYGHDLKRFNSKEEMLGYLAGYNDAIANIEYYGDEDV